MSLKAGCSAITAKTASCAVYHIAVRQENCCGCTIRLIILAFSLSHLPLLQRFY